MNRAAITGTGIYVPPHTISNEELVAAFNAYVRDWNLRNDAGIATGALAQKQESSVDFIEKASGIKQRYVIDKDGVLDPARMYPRFRERPNEARSLMAEIAVAAGSAALRQAGRTVDDVDGVICAAANMQRAYPAMAIEIQHALGIGGFGFDMNVACSSATFALDQAVNAVRCGTVRAMLVVNPEITSAHLEWRDRDCHFIFGDVCTAAVVGARGRGARGQLGGPRHAACHPLLEQHPQQLRLHEPVRGRRSGRPRQAVRPGRTQGVQGGLPARRRAHRRASRAARTSRRTVCVAIGFTRRTFP